MGHAMIAFGNYAERATLSEGVWIETLPLTNLLTREMGRIARSLTAEPSATKFRADLGGREAVRVFAALNHNIGLGGDYRLTGSNDAGLATPDYDSGWLPVWPAVYPFGTIEWGAPNFWERTLTRAEREGYPKHLIHLLPTTQRLRYWRLEISDAGNPDGFISAGRLFVADAWQPTNGVAFGSGIGWEDATTFQESLSGAEYADEKPPFRVVQLTTHFMGTDEALAAAFEIQRRAGTSKEVLYIADPDDTTHAIRRRFPGRLRTLSRIENPYPDLHQTSWEIREQIP